ncbi:CLUMA_CG009622, isoform A [Clunio marinus]|uniref:CLUMA_CG009622, isoform A n=1 Tax=Clunio marinus TaxID=568069 RepID=A0A1J1ICN0_9DIPT|nr:CLUMA_CG009622, isoform A [Clunio marinus]
MNELCILMTFDVTLDYKIPNLSIANNCNYSCKDFTTFALLQHFNEMIENVTLCNHEIQNAFNSFFIPFFPDLRNEP